MNIKSSKELVDKANESINIMSAEQVKKAYDKNEVTLIDVRDIRELWKEGTIKDAIHIPRGMLEFWLDPQSPYYQEKKIGEMKNIVLFCEKYTRQALANEDIYWRYSITTKTKLIPRFILTIANVWLDNGPYQETIERLCKEQGKISDDGECWVDKYSGYIIKTIDADTDEGYETSAFKNVSREIIEESVGDIVLEQSKKIADPNTEIIYIVISMSFFLRITN